MGQMSRYAEGFRWIGCYKLLYIAKQELVQIQQDIAPLGQRLLDAAIA